MTNWYGRTATRLGSRFGVAAQLFALLLLANLGNVQAQEIAQAESLTLPTGLAQDLAGVTGSFAPTTETSIVPKMAVPPELTPQTITLPPTEEFQQPLIAQTPPEEEEDDGPVDLLDEITVTTTRRRTTERENTQTTFVVTREDIKKVGARTVGDALKLAPGFFQVDSLGGVNSDNSTFVRGLDSSRFIFLIDGRPTARASDNRAADVGRTPVTNVERVEFITGGAGFRYSADAIGGVINVITQIPEGPPKVNVAVNFGSFGYSQYLIDYAGSNGTVAKNTDGTSIKDANGNEQQLPGYFAYQLQYERRTVLNKYPTTFYQEPVGIGIGGLPLILPTGERNPLYPGVVQNDRLQNPITINGETNGLYSFNDFYLAKLIFKPGQDHLITVNVSQLNSRLGSPLALANTSSCNILPASYNNVEGYGVTPPGTESVACRTSTLRSNPNPSELSLRSGRGDFAQDSTALNVIWEWKLSELSSLTTQVNYSSTFYDNPDGGPLIDFIDPDTGLPIYSNFSVSTRFVSDRVIDTQVRYQSQLAPNNTLNAGFQFTTLRFTATPGDEGVGIVLPIGKTLIYTDRETNRWALYLTEDLQFFDRAVILNIGTRLTNDLSYGTFLTSGVGFRYNFGGASGQEPFAVRATWSQSYKAPGLRQLYGEGDSVGLTTYIRNTGLQAETGTSYDFGLDILLSPDALFRATYFRTDLNNAIQDNVFLYVDNEFIDDDLVLSTINARSYLSTGWELSFNWKINDFWRFQASHTIVDARPLGDYTQDTINLGESGITESYLNSGYYYNYQTVDVPFSTTGVSLQYTSPSFNAAVIGQLVGLRPRGVFGPYYFPGYSKWDFTFSVPFSPSLTFNGGVFNFTNDRSVLASSAIKFAPGIVSPPTNFRVGLEFSF